jgi:hypothetical protein
MHSLIQLPQAGASLVVTMGGKDAGVRLDVALSGKQLFDPVCSFSSCCFGFNIVPFSFLRVESFSRPGAMNEHCKVPAFCGEAVPEPGN